MRLVIVLRLRQHRVQLGGTLEIHAVRVERGLIWLLESAIGGVYHLSQYSPRLTPVADVGQVNITYPGARPGWIQPTPFRLLLASFALGKVTLRPLVRRTSRRGFILTVVVANYAERRHI